MVARMVCNGPFSENGSRKTGVQVSVFSDDAGLKNSQFAGFSFLKSDT
jgi:hypothetical protein